MRVWTNTTRFLIPLSPFPLFVTFYTIPGDPDCSPFCYSVSLCLSHSLPSYSHPSVSVSHPYSLSFSFHYVSYPNQFLSRRYFTVVIKTLMQLSLFSSLSVCLCVSCSLSCSPPPFPDLAPDIHRATSNRIPIVLNGAIPTHQTLLCSTFVLLDRIRKCF